MNGTCPSPRRFSLRISVAILGVLLSWSATATAEQRQIGPFDVWSQFSLQPYVGKGGLFQDLAQIQRDLKRSLGVNEPKSRIHLHFFSDKSAYERYLRQTFPKVPRRPALFIEHKGKLMVFAYRGSNFETDVRHETTHALLHADLPMVPIWLDEGLAEYFELEPKRRATENPYLGKTRWSAQFGIAPRITSLEKKADLADMGAAEYRYAWAWVHFMLHGPREAHAQLVGYLADIRNHTPPGQLSDRLKRSVPRVEKRFVEHFRSWRR
jgi:hypothetical protein